MSFVDLVSWVSEFKHLPAEAFARILERLVLKRGYSAKKTYKDVLALVRCSNRNLVFQNVKFYHPLKSGRLGFVNFGYLLLN